VSRVRSTSANTSPTIDGFTAPGWERVRDAFAATFARHGETGAAVCVYHAGEPVADLAAGVADLDSGRPYTRRMLQPFMSVSKGILAIAASMLADRKVIDLDAPVARYWPEFAQAGKEAIPVRWLLTHQAGLAALDRPLARDELLSSASDSTCPPPTGRLAAPVPSAPSASAAAAPGRSPKPDSPSPTSRSSCSTSAPTRARRR